MKSNIYFYLDLVEIPFWYISTHISELLEANATQSKKKKSKCISYSHSFSDYRFAQSNPFRKWNEAILIIDNFPVRLFTRLRYIYKKSVEWQCHARHVIPRKRHVYPKRGNSKGGEGVDRVRKVGASVRATTTRNLRVPRSIIAYAFGRINSDQLQASAIAITALTITLRIPGIAR